MQLKFKVGYSKKLNNIRCLIATEDINAGTIIEQCPVIIFPIDDYLLNHPVIGNYVFSWDQENDCYLFGYGELINHSFEPNVIYKRNYENKSMDLIAYVDIQKDAELFINYNGDPLDKTPLDSGHTNFQN